MRDTDFLIISASFLVGRRGRARSDTGHVPVVRHPRPPRSSDCAGDSHVGTYRPAAEVAYRLSAVRTPANSSRSPRPWTPDPPGTVHGASRFAPASPAGGGVSAARISSGLARSRISDT